MQDLRCSLVSLMASPPLTFSRRFYNVQHWYYLLRQSHRQYCWLQRKPWTNDERIQLITQLTASPRQNDSCPQVISHSRTRGQADSHTLHRDVRAITGLRKYRIIGSRAARFKRPYCQSTCLSVCLCVCVCVCFPQLWC